MPRLSTLEPADAPDGARQILDDLIDRHGDAGAMVRTMAQSPALLRGYLDLSRAMKRAKLARTVSETVSLAVQEWIGCELCLADLHDHDWSDRAIADVIGLVALNQLTGSFNLIADRQPDATPNDGAALHGGSR